MLPFFVAEGTLWITKWRRRRPSRQPTTNAGGGITGFQNGLAIASDYMSAASFSVFPAFVWQRLRRPIFSIGWLVG